MRAAFAARGSRRMFGMGGTHARSAAASAKKAKAAARPELVCVTVKLEPRHREKLKLLGGDDWLREQLEKARLEANSRD